MRNLALGTAALAALFSAASQAAAPARTKPVVLAGPQMDRVTGGIRSGLPWGSVAFLGGGSGAEFRGQSGNDRAAALAAWRGRGLD
jgi:hypothetical protein